LVASHPGQVSTTVAVVLFPPALMVIVLPHKLEFMTEAGNATIISFSVLVPPQLPRPGVKNESWPLPLAEGPTLTLTPEPEAETGVVEASLGVVPVGMLLALPPLWLVPWCPFARMWEPPPRGAANAERKQKNIAKRIENVGTRDMLKEWWVSNVTG